MTLEHLQLDHRKEVGEIGQETAKLAEERVLQLFARLDRFHPRGLKMVMGVWIVTGDGVVGVNGDVLSFSDFLDRVANGAPWTPAKRLTGEEIAAAIELVGLLEWVAQTPEIPNIQIP